MQAEPRATGIKAIVYNKSAFPARALTDSSFRYYFRREGTSAIQVTSGYTQGCPAPTTATQLSGDIWYVEVDCVGHTIAPAGQSAHRMEVQFKIGVPEGGTWDPTNDPSYQATAGPNPKVALYEGGTLIWGAAPGPITPDTTAPSAPGTPTASAVTATGATLNWTAATDNVGVAGYDVYRENGATDVLVGSPTVASLAVTGLTAATTYQFYVVARDAAGNRSTGSAPVAVTTGSGGGDTTAPGTPTGLTVSAITPTGATLGWTASTDNVGVTGYRVYREAGATDTLLATVAGTSYPVTGLTSGTTYQFYVLAVDAAGNVSAASTPVSVTTSTVPASGCRIGYTTNDWGSGFSGTVTITNTGTTAVNGWTLAFSFGAGQRISQAWSATVTQSGTAVTATNLSYNGTLAPGASTSFGFNGSHTGSNPRPTSFTLNGAACATG
jgi:chitodextrinase